MHDKSQERGGEAVSREHEALRSRGSRERLSELRLRQTSAVDVTRVSSAPVAMEYQ